VRPVAARLEPETVRKWIHLAPGLMAFAVRYLGPSWSIAVTGALLAFNLWLFPRLGGASLRRPGEIVRGEAPGVLFYPAALLILAVAARGRLEILAGGWGMLAFGDAVATLVGRRWGVRLLPWNRSKTWLGSTGFFLTSWLVTALLVAWTAPSRYTWTTLALATGIAALVGAVVESLPWTVDDNLSVTLLGSGALYLALAICERVGVSSVRGGFLGLAAVIVLVAVSRWTGAVDG